MRNDRQVNRAVLCDDLVEPDFRITVGIPAGGDVLRPSWGGDKNPVHAKRLAIPCGFDRLVCSNRPCAREDWHLSVCFFHRDFEHSPLFLSREIKDFSRFGIDAEPSPHTDEFLVFYKVAEEATVSLLVDFHSAVERQQHGHVEMVANSFEMRFHRVSSGIRYILLRINQSGLASISTKATMHGAFERFAHA